MDNLCHTLVGVALAQAGLKTRTALGTSTLVIGANLPDIDVISVWWGNVASFAVRRGWTHGILALLILPVVLTGWIVAWDRLARRRGGRVPRTVVKPREVLLLSAISILSHPTLDYMNTYGMRWLMPFQDRWFYGDVLFIVDPWLWLVLGAGSLVAWWLGRRRQRGGAAGQGGRSGSSGRGHGNSGEGLRPMPSGARRAARVAIAIAAAYTAIMVVSSLVARRIVAREMASAGFGSEVRAMVAPIPVNPFRRAIVFDTGEEDYRFGTFNWLPVPALRFDEYRLARRASHPAAVVAAETEVGRTFLHWARFPFFVIERAQRATIVRIADARYTRDAADSWAAVTVRLPSGR